MAAWVEVMGIVVVGVMALWRVLAPEPALQLVPIRSRRPRR